MEIEEQMRTGRMGMLLAKFSIPAIIGMFFTSLYNMADMIFVGKGVGSDGLAVLTVCFPFMIMTMGFGILVSGGGASLLSRALGAKDRETANTTVSNATVLSLLIGIILTIGAFVFMDPLLRSMGSSERLLPMTRGYFLYSLIGNVIFPLVICLIYLLQAGGRPKASMATMVSGCLLNLVLDPLFIFGFNMGVDGAALATSFSQGLSLLTGLSFLLLGRKFATVKLKYFVPKIAILKEILGIGLAPFLSMMGSSLVLILANNLIGKYGGDLYLSILGIVTKLNMFLKLPINGLGQGMQPLAGHNFGAKNLERVKEVSYLTMVVGSLFSILVFAVAMLFPQFLLEAFSNEKAIIEAGIDPLRIMMFSFILAGIMESGLTLFVAIGKKIQALIVSLAYRLFCLLPIMIIAPLFIGLNGVLLAFPVSELVGATIICLLVYREWKRFAEEKIQYI
ncbi:MAG: MATE family efflux transporter [Anaerolineae bacterium]|nr:MATE family efflux transporter [Anaerolineae bacterium]